MAKLSTHVLDTAHGHPANGMTIDFARLSGGGDGEELIKSVITNADGRTDELLLDSAEMKAGEYELRFHVAAYFRSKKTKMPEPAFLNIVPIRFTIFDATENYHVPLLCSPWSFSTYRGS